MTRSSVPCQAPAPWHFLYFLPLPQGQGSFRPTLGSSRFTVLITSSPPVRAGVGACRPADDEERAAPANAGTASAAGLFIVTLAGARRGDGRGGRAAGAPASVPSPITGRSQKRYRTISSSIRAFMSWNRPKLSFLYSTSGSRWP